MKYTKGQWVIVERDDKYETCEVLKYVKQSNSYLVDGGSELVPANQVKALLTPETEFALDVAATFTRSLSDEIVDAVSIVVNSVREHCKRITALEEQLEGADEALASANKTAESCLNLLEQIKGSKKPKEKRKTKNSPQTCEKCGVTLKNMHGLKLHKSRYCKYRD